MRNNLEKLDGKRNVGMIGMKDRKSHWMPRCLDDDDDDDDDYDGYDGDHDDDDGLGQPISGLLESRPPKSSAASENQFPFLQNVDQQRPGAASFRAEIQTRRILRERDF